MSEAVFVHEGLSIDHTPGAAVVSGEVVVQGDLVGVAKQPIAAGDLGALALDGVFDFAKQSSGGVTFTAGDNAYWDDTANVAVTADGGGANKLIGKAVKDAADADSTVRIRLSP